MGLFTEIITLISCSETNLKTRMAKEETADLGEDPVKLSAQLGCIECDAPNSALSVFDGKYTNAQGKSVPLSNENVLLRVCCILDEFNNDLNRVVS